MALPKRLAFIGLGIVSLVIVAALARAQTPAPRGSSPTIISGSDLGFRIAGQRGDRVTGTLMVRINGEWVVAEPVAGIKALTGK
jgi:hypothetical protein